MADFINTIDVLGDDAVVDSIIDRSITEFKDDTLTTVGASAFRECTLLTTVNLPSLTTVGVAAFSGCISLMEVDLPNMMTAAGDAFGECKSLKTVNLPSLTTATGSRHFRHCTGLESVYVPKLQSISGEMFSGSSGIARQYDKPTKIRTLDLPVCTAIGANAFNIAGRLSSIILRANQVASLAHTNVFNLTPIASGSGYIYVPKALVDSYKTATNWSTFADKIRAVEDYTADGSLNGEFLDPVKCVYINANATPNWSGTGTTDFIEVSPGTSVTIISTINFHKLKAEMFDEQKLSLGTYIGDFSADTISGTLDENAKYIKIQFKWTSGCYQEYFDVSTFSIGDTIYIPSYA